MFLATLVGHHDAYICTGKYGISRNALMIDLKGLYYSTILDQKEGSTGFNCVCQDVEDVGIVMYLKVLSIAAIWC